VLKSRELKTHRFLYRNRRELYKESLQIKSTQSSYIRMQGRRRGTARRQTLQGKKNPKAGEIERGKRCHQERDNFKSQLGLSIKKFQFGEERTSPVKKRRGTIDRRGTWRR